MKKQIQSHKGHTDKFLKCEIIQITFTETGEGFPISRQNKIYLHRNQIKIFPYNFQVQKENKMKKNYLETFWIF